MLKQKIPNNINWKSASILLGYPLILAIVLELSLQQLSYSSHLNFFENVLFFLVVLLAVNLLAGFKYGRPIANVLIIFFYAILLLETGLYLLFQTRINAAYIHVVLNSNLSEVQEFSTIYFKHNLIWLILFFVPCFSFFSKKIYRNTYSRFKGVFLNLLIILSLLLVVKFTYLTEWNFPYVTIKSFAQYQKQLKVFDDFSKRSIKVDTKLVTDNDVIVVVIGESTTRKHMGIYGYKRNTTPRLQQLSDSLIIYNDVISSHVFTTSAMFDAFTFSNGDKTDFLLDYIKNAGYKVYWLSNQRPVGFHDNLVSRIASIADESLFLSYNDYRHKTLLDEVLLPLINEKLIKKEKKVIFTHLIGTHYDYSKRYPEEFDKYSSSIRNKKNKIVDTYDNSILYNDFIVSEIVKKVQSLNEKSAVIYFSDHGEEVFDTVDFFGHFEDKPTATMYQIPFLVYMSSNYEKPEDFFVDENRPFMLDNFAHSLTHFLGIESKSLRKDRSLFSNSFIEKPRIVSDSLKFDYFEKK